MTPVPDTSTPDERRLLRVENSMADLERAFERLSAELHQRDGSIATFFITVGEKLDAIQRDVMALKTQTRGAVHE